MSGLNHRFAKPASSQGSAGSNPAASAIWKVNRSGCRSTLERCLVFRDCGSGPPPSSLESELVGDQARLEIGASLWDGGGDLLFPQEIYGELAERSIAPVLKTGVPQGTGGSNPSLSAELR